MKDALKVHYQSGILHEVEQETTSGVYTAEIIHKDQILISKIQANAAAGTEGQKNAEPKHLELLPGAYSEMSEDGSALKALITGYPHLEQKMTGGSLSVKVDIVPLVYIAEDNMQALLTLYPALTNIPPLDKMQLTDILHEESIIYGIDQAMLQESIDQLANLKRPLYNIPIARGILPIDGKDAYLRFELEIGPIPGKILRDGTIDFRERKIFTGVDENQVIACKVPETTGSPGINISGESIPQWPGKDIVVKISGDAAYIPETRQVIATRAGVLSTVNGNDIKVSAKQTISGDIDFSVGNIESKNNVDIKGCVHPGFRVQTGGDLLIGGNVEAATISSKGNVVVKGGLLGETTRLETQGDADINFIERAQLIAGGGIILRKGAYYSTVIGDSDICCSPESRIVGGEFCCTGNFAGGNVGSYQAGPATIAAGVDNKRYKKYARLKQQIADLEAKLTTLNDRDITKSVVEEIYQKYGDELQELQSLLRRFNLIPETPLYSRTEPTFNHCDARITIHGTAAIATQLRIGNLMRTLDDEYTAVEFYIDDNSGRIDVQDL